eukprot:scaffold26137_cov82-Phaeocystis_antarctica.AAC.3
MRVATDSGGVSGHDDSGGASGNRKAGNVTLLRKASGLHRRLGNERLGLYALDQAKLQSIGNTSRAGGMARRTHPLAWCVLAKFSFK